MTDFEEIRNWIEQLPGSIEIKEIRLYWFDMLRYSERYDEIFEFITGMGWHE